MSSRYASETFLRRDDAGRPTPSVKSIETPTKSRTARLKTFGELIDLHIDDMCDVGKSPRRSKAAALAMLQRHLGKCNIAALDRERLIRFGRDRAAQGAGPMTLGIDIGFIKLILSHAAAVHGLPVKVEPVDLARIALKRLGGVGKGCERDRRPTQDELDRLVAHFDSNPLQIAPVGRIIRFAVASAMRQEEICKARWSELDSRTRMLLIRDRKDPRDKKGNNQRIPLFATTGYDAWAIVEEQRTKRSNDDDRIFPFNHRSVGTAFRRGCADLGIHSSWAWSRTRENAVIALKPESLVELAAHEFDSGDAELQPPPFGTIDATALHIAQLIKAELAQRESANELYIDSLITLFGVHLLRKYTSQKKPTAKLTSGLSSSSTRRLQEFLSENFARKLSVGELAAVAGFSPGHFIQAFTKTFGTPPHSHVVKLRLDFAEKLLVKGSLTVAEVAYLSGFSSQSHLTASMTKHRSTTPTQMRARRER